MPAAASISALLKGWLHVGSAEWVARLPSLVAVALTAAAAVRARGRVSSNRRVGLAAGVLFATSAYTTGIGRSAGPLALAVLAATLATWLFVVAMRVGRGRISWSGVCGGRRRLGLRPRIVRPRPRRPCRGARCHATARREARTSWRAIFAGRRCSAGHRAGACEPPPPCRRRSASPALADVARALHDASGRNVALIALAAAGIARHRCSRSRAARWRRGEAALLISWARVAARRPLLVLSIARPSLDPALPRGVHARPGSACRRRRSRGSSDGRLAAVSRWSHARWSASD